MSKNRTYTSLSASASSILTELRTAGVPFWFAGGESSAIMALVESAARGEIRCDATLRGEEVGEIVFTAGSSVARPSVGVSLHSTGTLTPARFAAVASCIQAGLVAIGALETELDAFCRRCALTLHPMGKDQIAAGIAALGPVATDAERVDFLDDFFAKAGI